MKVFEKFNLATLDQKAAQELGHVAWIESDNAEDALRNMVSAVQTQPYNVAIWADAAKSIDPVLLQNLQAAREKYSTRAYKVRGRGEFEFESEDKISSAQEARQRLRDLFAQKSAYGIDDETGMRLENHIATRLTQIFSALHPKICSFSVDPAGETNEWFIPHMDNNGPGIPNWVRLIEALEGPSTLLIDNRDVNWNPETGHRGLKEKNSSTLWHAPENSLILLTNRDHPFMPIMHAWPVTLTNESPCKRTVNIYDFNL